MNKKICILLIITISTLSHSMEKIDDDNDSSDILLCIPKHILPINTTNTLLGEQYASLKRSLDALTKDITFLNNNNPFDEKTAQTITRCIAHHALDNEVYISDYLSRYNNNFKIVRDKIKKIIHIASSPHEQFSEEDLSENWYINATYGTQSLTPLSCTYFILQPQKIELLLNAGANAKQRTNNNILKKIARTRSKSLPSVQDIQKLPVLLTVAELLLQHGAHPDFRLNNDPTSLMIAVCGNDKTYAHLLLWHNADPCKKGIWIDSSLKNSFEVEKARDHCCEKNAFEMEPTGWLHKMVNQRKNILFNHLLFKYYSTQPECTLLPELVQLIIRNLWHIGKTYNEK